MQDRTRREFIIDSAKITGAALGAATLGQGVLSPRTSEAASQKFPESNCGVNNENGQKVLIAYASQCGSTGDRD